LLDLCFCALLLLPTAYASYCLDGPSAGGFEFALLFVGYNSYFLAFKNGATPGKYIQNIQVLSPLGRSLQGWQATVRAACLGAPWALISLDASSNMALAFPLEMRSGLPTIGAMWIALDALLIECARDKRSLTDRIASTIVVALPPLQPHRAPAVPMFSAHDAEFGTPPKRPPKE
jgi:uncharacterized RDD family membrane protein YckC